MRINDDFHLTNDYHEIIELVYKFRFINRRQIQKFFGHKVPRRVNPWLKDLVEHKFLGRIYSRNKLLENTKPAIYYLDNEGIGWARSNYYEDEPEKVKRFYQDKKASERFINHSIALTDLYVNGIPPKQNEDDQYHFSTSTELWHNEDLINIRPDALVDHLVGDEISMYFLELIEDYVPMYAVRYKIDQYIKLRSEGDRWDIYAEGFDFDRLIVRLILPNQQKLNRVRRYIKGRLEESYDVENLIFMLTTYEKITTEGLTADIWKEVKEEEY